MVLRAVIYRNCNVFRMQPLGLSSRKANIVTFGRYLNLYTGSQSKLHRIEFKILLITFKALHGRAPSYLSDLISVSNNGRYNLMSSTSLLLKHSAIKSKSTLRDRSIHVAAPKLWKTLPSSINFNKSLKTYLFRNAF